ncbi:zinc finger protein 320-like [Contarinia nasturtii]|uniref:zinc finger protein 320-like n=1 Tax=Contarinia nasturtii TaxID=265458 RepID=UPI0012D4BAC7|nr:zinc finger protein 320-like [Contarinia nasturtii]
MNFQSICDHRKFVEKIPKATFRIVSRQRDAIKCAPPPSSFNFFRPWVDHANDKTNSENKSDAQLYLNRNSDNIKMQTDNDSECLKKICNTNEFSYEIRSDGNSDDDRKEIEKTAVTKIDQTPENRRKKHKCFSCEYVTLHKGHFEKHARIHLGRRFKCDLCQRGFYTTVHLKKHKRLHRMGLVDTKDAPKCKICDEKFSNERNLSDHHSCVMTFECEICQKKFANKYSLDSHLEVHVQSLTSSYGTCGQGLGNEDNKQMQEIFETTFDSVQQVSRDESERTATKSAKIDTNNAIYGITT